MNQKKNNEEKNTRDWYQNYSIQKGKHRNDLLRNPEVLFQSLAYDASVVYALRSSNIDPKTVMVLDVGCGGGGSLLNFIKLGFFPPHLTGIDILEERISRAKERFPDVNFVHGDASSMDFLDVSFDIVTESTMFMQLTDENLAQSIADEMIRVSKSKGHIILFDWRYSKPWDQNYKALSIKRIKRLFKVESETKIRGIFKGSLIPPLGRFISKRVPSFYFIVQALMPFLVGQLAVVLKKN